MVEVYRPRRHITATLTVGDDNGRVPLQGVRAAPHNLSRSKCCVNIFPIRNGRVGKEEEVSANVG